MVSIYSLYYSIPYLIISIFLLLISKIEICKKSLRSKDNICIIIFIILLIFIGFRGFIYTDFVSYYPFYDDLFPLEYLVWNIQQFENFEIGFVVYSTIIKTVSSDYHFWILVNTIIDLIVLLIFFKRYSPSVALSFFVFFAFSGLIIEFNLYRNSKSIILFLLSIKYIKEKRIIPYIILNLIGVSFHVSSLIYIPMYYILNRNIPKYIIFSIAIILNIVFIFKLSIVENIINIASNIQDIPLLRTLSKFSLHAEYAKSLGISVSYLERNFTFILFSLLYSKLIKLNSYNVIFINCFYIYYIFMLMFYEVDVFQQRIPLLFVFSYWIVYPQLLNVDFKYKKYIIIVVICMIIYKVISQNISFISYYDNILWGIKRFEERYSNFYLYYYNLNT